MNTRLAIAAAIAISASLTAPSAGATEVAPLGCNGTPPAPLPIRVDTARAALPAMLRAEGYPVPKAADVSVRHVELDGDSSTEEALVDVVAREVCSMGSCPTIIVVSRDGALSSVGSGAWITALPTRTAGWRDLLDNTPTGVPVLPGMRPLL